MRLRWTFTLIFINVILIWLVAGGLVKPATRQGFESTISSFLPLQKADWDYLAISTDQGEWSAQRDSWGRWWLKSPVEWPGRYERFSKVISFLTTLKIESAFSAGQLKRVGQSLQSYGLEKPQGVLEIGSQGKVERYKIGSPTPLGEKLYVLSERSNEIWVVNRELLTYIDPAYEPYKADGFFPFDLVELENVSVQLGESVFKLERKLNTSRWQLLLGEQTIALKQGLWGLYLDRLGQQAPSEFVKLDASAQGLKTPAGRLIFKTLYGRRALLIGSLANTQQRWVQWEGSKNVFTLPQSLLDELKPESFVAKSLLDLPIEAVTQLSWKGATESFVLNRGQEGWLVQKAQGEQSNVDSTAIKQYLLYLISIKSEPFFKEPVFISDAPTLIISTDSQSFAYRFSSDYTLASSGRLHYRFDKPFTPPLYGDLASKMIFTPQSSDPSLVLWDSQAVEGPLVDALGAALKRPQATSILEEVPTLKDSHILKLVWESGFEVELTLGKLTEESTDTLSESISESANNQEGGVPEDLSAAPRGAAEPMQSQWVMVVDQKAYTPTSAWIAIFENLINK